MYCTDILIQVAAVNAALNSFNKELLCRVTSATAWHEISVRARMRLIEELVVILQKLMK